jgi:hypothetical protein
MYASYSIIPIAIPIKIYTGKTSKKPIIIDLVSVAANPPRKNIAITTAKELLIY